VNLKRQDQSEGFAELLEIAGEDLTWNGQPFRALIATTQPGQSRYDLTPADDNAVRVRAFLSEFPGGLPRPGHYFTDEDGATYRIEDVERTPRSLTVTFTCEVTYAQ
jgi:hypothetical protein